MPALFHPVLPEAAEADFLYYIITNFLKVMLVNSAFGLTLLTVVMVALQGIYLNAVANRYKLFAKPNYVPGFIYISLTSLCSPFVTFSQPLLINWVLIMTISCTLQLSQTTRPRKLIYNTGFAIGLAGLIMFPAVVYVLLLLIAISMLRNLNPGEWMVAILGAITPVYFAMGLLYLFDVLNWVPGWVYLEFNLPGKLVRPGLTIFISIGVVLLFIMGVYALQRQLNRVNMFVRRAWTVAALGMGLAVAVILFSDDAITQAWIMLFPFATIVIANAYNAEKNKAFSNFAFYLTLLLVIICKLAGT